jgi:hypothetical protein
MHLALLLGIALLATPVLPAGAADEPPSPNTGALALTVSFTFPTSYYFRGIAQSNAGFQVQPYLELKTTLYEGGEKDVLTAAYLKAAGFAHLQSTAAPVNTNYYEQDIYLTGGLTFFKRLTLEGGWNLYAYPGLGSGAQVQEVFGKLVLDDSGFWPFGLPGEQDFALSPYALLACETSGAADGARTLGGGYGIYLEFGVDPGHSVTFTKNWSARFHLPFAVGLSVDKYYEVATSTGISDSTFGFADLGFMVDVPLKFIPARYGKWTFSGGPHLLWLGTNTKKLAGPSSNDALNGLNVTGGAGFEVWAAAGIKIEY